MPLLGIGHQQYWSPAAVGSPGPPGGSGKGGYVAWQTNATWSWVFFLVGLIRRSL